MNKGLDTNNKMTRHGFKPWYYLLNEEFYRFLMPLITICAFNMAGQLLLIGWASRDYSMMLDRYESFYVRSGAVILFLISLSCLIGSFVLHFYNHYWGSKSIYTLMTLPMSRTNVYVCLLLAYFLGIMLFLILSIVTVTLGYCIYISRQMSIESGKYIMKNGLYLAFIRSDFLRVLVPLTWKSLLSSLSLWILLPISVLYGAVCERSLRYWNLGLTGAALVLMILTVSQRINHNADYIIPSSVVMFLLSCIFVWHSLKIINKNGITG